MASDQEKENLKNTLRVIQNTRILLDSEGLFKGKHAMALVEGQQLLANLAADLTKKLEESALILPSKSLIELPIDAIRAENPA